MTDSEKKVLEGFLSKTLKIDTEEFASLYNEAGELTSLSIASEADTQRIKKLKEDTASQFKRGIKEGAGKIEKELKEKYELDSELEGIELIDFIITHKITEGKEGSDDVTKHPDYIKLKFETDKLLKNKDKEWQKKLDDRETEFKRQAVFGKVKDKALAELENLNPILPEDARKAAKWKEKFIEEIARFEYQENDSSVVVLKEGKPVSDSHGYSLTFPDHIKTIASDMFEFRASDSRTSPGHQSTPTPPAFTPRSNSEYIDAMQKAKTPQERVQIMRSYIKK